MSAGPSRVIHAWPRGMRVEIAAAYCGISEPWLQAALGRQEFPAPVRLSAARVIWLKDDLDRWLDEKAGRSKAGAGDASGPQSADALSDWDRAFGGSRAA